MAEFNTSSEINRCEDSILYELLVYAEWNLDAESTLSVASLPAPKGSLFRQFLALFSSKFTVPELIYEQKGCRFPWQFCIGEGGKAIAILQDASLEIRSSKDGYCTIIGKASVPKDEWPQWRQMAWSPDCSFLAVANSNGSVNFYDLLGCKIFTIAPDWKAQGSSVCKEIEHGIVGIIFLQNRIREHKWSYEVLIVDFIGNLYSFLISPTDGYKLNHKFSFSSYFSSGISAVALHPAHPVLVVSGYGNKEYGSTNFQENGCSVGLSCWRILNDSPFYKLSDNMNEPSDSKPWIGWTGKAVGVIFKLSISSSGTSLACLHSCGTISIWRMPSLRIVNIWRLIDQPDFNIPNPLLADKKFYKGITPKKMSTHSPIDISWWNEDAIILSRYNGAVSVNSVKDLKNLLGNSPEFLSGQPQVSALMFDKGFITLECESVLNVRKSIREPDDDFEEDTDQVDSDISDVQTQKDLIDYIMNIIKYSLYVVTDLDKFRPPLPVVKSLTRTYRMLGLKSSTPEELYSRKIDSGDYNEALSLAKIYNLDTDLVYKRQWQNSKVCNQSISEYLSKIKKRWWVLQQCVERVADDLDATRELLLFGLRVTGVETFVNGESSQIDNIIQTVQKTRIEEGHEKNDEEILNEHNFESINNEQKQLIRYRILIQKYLDRLFLYEMILDNNSDYESKAYNEFRTCSILYSATQLARKGACKSLGILLTYHLDELKEHLFPLLSNLPETLDPLDFWNLLPECDTEGRIIPFEKKQIRCADWCESEQLRSLYKLHASLVADSSDFLYAESSSLTSYHGALDPALVTQWYLTRSQEIEQRTGMIDHALKLINIAIEKNVQNLNAFHFDLKTLDCLAYEVQIDNVTLADLQQCTKLERGKWLMEKTTQETFIDDLSNLFLTYIHKSDDNGRQYKMKLMQEYILHLSENDLKWALNYFEHLKNCSQSNESTKINLDHREKINLAVKCIYANKAEDLEQIELAGMILESLPEIDDEHPMSNALADLEAELQCSKLLRLRAVPRSPAELRATRSDAARASDLLNQLARSVLRKDPSEIEWNDLLTDLINIRDSVFVCINMEQVFEIYVTTLLLCGQKKDIESAAEVMHCSSSLSREPRGRSVYADATKIPYARSVKLILEAAREYFDSSRSLDDKNMDLAKACLLLITDENDEVQEELDLIAAVKILHSFNIPILPIQVRLCPDRLRLIESCLNSGDQGMNASKYSHNYSVDNALLELAKKLRIYGDDEKKRDGAVLEMLTKNALQRCAWSACWSHCRRLVQGRHGDRWRVAAELARQGDSLSADVRGQALDFALLHCDADAIEELLTIRDEIEVKELKLQLQFLTGGTLKPSVCQDEVKEVDSEAASTSDVQEERGISFTPSLSTMKELPGNIGKVIKLFDPTNLLKDSTQHLMSHIVEQGFLKRDQSVESDTTVQSNFIQPSYPTFYASLHKDCLESNFYSRYDKFSNTEITSKELQICRILLKLVVLEHNINPTSPIPNMDEVMVQYATHALPEDITLGLSALMMLEDPLAARRVFDALPVTVTSLRTSLYYIAMRIVSSDQDLDFQTETPDHLLKLALSVEHTDKNEELFSMLEEYRDKLRDLCQAGELQTLGCGVDTQRFTTDDDYRRDSILGLAMSPNLDRYNLALKLGTRYGINLSSIAFEHVSSLLQSSEVPMNVLVERLADKELLGLLKEQSDETCNRLANEVFSTLDGTQHEMLMCYYTLVHKVNPDYITQGLLSKEHVKLLKKIKSSCSAIDYTLLLSPPDNFVSRITWNVAQDQLPVLCQLLKSLPTQLSSKCQYTQSLLYKEWCIKHISQYPIHSSTKEYIDIWSSIRPIFAKINAEDFKMFVCKVCLNPKSVNRISISTRLAMLKQAIAYCNERMKQDRIEGWGYTHSDFLKWEHVLFALGGEAWQNLSVHGEDVTEVIKMVQISCTNQELLVTAFMELLKLENIPLTDIITAMKEIPEAPNFFTIIKVLTKTCTTDLISQETLQNLMLVIMRLEHFIMVTNGTMVSAKEETSFGSGDWDNEWNIDDDLEDQSDSKIDALSDKEKTELSDILLPLCGDSKIPPTLRLRLMKVLQDFNISSDGDFGIVMLYQHTQATVTSAWGVENENGNNVVADALTDMDLSTEEGRFQIFAKLLENVKEWIHVECLNDLLTYWPKFLSSEFTDDKSPLCLLLERILELDLQNSDNLCGVLTKISESCNLPEQVIKDLHSKYKNNISDRLAILFGILFYDNTESTNYLKLHIVEIINRIEGPLEENILRLIASKHLTSEMVGSKHYKNILEYSLIAKTLNVKDAASPAAEPEVIIEDLLKSRLVAEAGAFSLSAIGTPASLRTFSSALKWAKRLYNADDDEE